MTRKTMTRNSSKASTEEIWRNLSDRLRQFILARVHSDFEVDDILQNVFLRIHQKLPSLRSHDRLEAWVFQITRNAMIDHFRSGRKIQNLVSPETRNDDSGDLENLNNPTSGCLAAMIESLPDDQRRAVSMYELDGISQQEIANRESISLSGVKSRIQRGRQNLKAMMLECCQFDFDRRGNIIQCASITGNENANARCHSPRSENQAG